MMRKYSYNRRGFTLTEALIAMTVLVIAAGGVLIPFTSSAAVHVEGSRRTIASQLAADLVEEITSSLENASDADYSTVMNYWDNFYESEGNVTEIWRSGSYSGDVYKYFSRRSTCKEATIGSGRNVTVLGAWVTVTVNYDGREMSTLSTLVTRSN